MEHDIRDLFKNEEASKTELPKKHLEEFIKKLESSNFNKKKNYTILKIVASVLLIFSCIYFYKTGSNSLEKTAFEIQIEEMEKDYLMKIDKEWSYFIKDANDTILVKKYKAKLKDYNVEYKEIAMKLNESPESINLLESLIENLQRRLQLIKSINEHLKELNQKNTSNETIYL
ncbi:MAG: hypothetical protein WAO74_12410 [Polaribacter sp.]|uniref:hypothetical protein n=1 Tax=Polaribacter sp. TaxID=1920175 RepID=UPI003BB06D09